MLSLDYNFPVPYQDFDDLRNLLVVSYPATDIDQSLVRFINLDSQSTFAIWFGT